MLEVVVKTGAKSRTTLQSNNHHQQTNINYYYYYCYYCYPRRARSAIGVDTVLTLDVCLYVSALERKRLIGMT